MPQVAAALPARAPGAHTCSSTRVNSTVQVVVKLRGDSSVGLEASDPTRERERGLQHPQTPYLLRAAWLGYEYFPFDVGVLEDRQESP